MILHKHVIKENNQGWKIVLFPGYRNSQTSHISHNFTCFYIKTGEIALQIPKFPSRYFINFPVMSFLKSQYFPPTVRIMLAILIVSGLVFYGTIMLHNFKEG